MVDRYRGGRRGGERWREGPRRPVGPVRAEEGLRALIRSIDGAPFGAYRRLVGRHALEEFSVVVDRVPPDPFAGPARIRLVVDRGVAGMRKELVATRLARIAVEDDLAEAAERTLASERDEPARNAPPGSGLVRIEAGGPAVLERSACRITEQAIELRLLVDLPADRRRVRGAAVERLFFERLRRLATASVLFSARRVEEASARVRSIEDHAGLLAELDRRGLVAFVADGSLLARAGGDDPGPRRDGREVPFEAPSSLAVEVDLPHAGAVRGLGIPAGVTLIVGGAFHGKSTLLDAIASGVHPHRPGDGRERVGTRPDAVVVRSEPGRTVRRVDLAAFFDDLPSGARAADFSTDRASGSTSQAASIVEAIECGSRLLLLDEDTSAGNLLVRDGRMQRLVPRPGEPIIPFLDRVRDLYDRRGVSTILVTGGSGDYLAAADTVIRMDAYRAADVAAEAREIVAATRSMRLVEAIAPLVPPRERTWENEPPAGGARLRAGLRGPRGMRLGDETIDLRAVAPIEETNQVRAIALLAREALRRADRGTPIAEVVRRVDAWLDAEGIDAVDPPASYDLARPRAFEIAAALNRWAGLRPGRPDRREGRP